MCPDDPDLLVRHRERRQARIVGRLLAQAAVSVALLVFLWWGMYTLGVHTHASEGPSSEAWLRPVYVGGCPIGGVGLGEDPPEAGCSEEGPPHPSGSRRPGAGLDEPLIEPKSRGSPSASARTSENSPSTHSGE